ncbi:MAG: L-aspartate oxidase [Firmicutes bacterium HGW-Firmicutes-1]|jgi:L-aspartate oxidase|nr:MAG: L-aspartate oxidase [Firmicutes bacterium HGW-Firmicutes-1]
MNGDIDVIIVGTGLAGLYCAMHLREDLKVVLLTNSKTKDCNTYLAQGGITTVLDEEDKSLFVEDTLKAGMYKNVKEAVETVANEAMDNILTLKEIGVAFDEKGNGFDYTSEGGHSVNRIVHCADLTGKRVFETVLGYVQKKKNISIYEDIALVDIIVEEDTCKGVLILKDNEPQAIYSKRTVLATGGIGGLFKRSTNQRDLKGVATAIAIRHGIEIKDTECIQYHPTGLYDPDHREKHFLISESLRGEGAKLINIQGNRFIDELLPRNVVTKAMLEEQKVTNSEFQYLDISFKDEKYLKNRFPLIYNECKERGIDITKGPIPVTPVQHYAMGGIGVNLDSQTSMQNLYACGECSCTGLHGANRMASNSLLEALVFSRRAALQINIKINEADNKYMKTPILIDRDQVQVLLKQNEEIIIEHIKKVRGDLIYELVEY